MIIKVPLQEANNLRVRHCVELQPGNRTKIQTFSVLKVIVKLFKNQHRLKKMFDKGKQIHLLEVMLSAMMTQQQKKKMVNYTNQLLEMKVTGRVAFLLNHN